MFRHLTVISSFSVKYPSSIPCDIKFNFKTRPKFLKIKYWICKIVRFLTGKSLFIYLPSQKFGILVTK